MGLPEIQIEFSSKATTAVKRSGRGVVALILRDNTKAFNEKEYTSITEIEAEDWTAANKDYIEKTFLGTPAKVICIRVAVDAADYNAALTRLKLKKWNYLAIPGIAEADVPTIAAWIKAERDNNRKTYKAVLPDIAADHEGIINFATTDIKVGSKTYTASEYCARIAGILAGIPLSRSATFYSLEEVEGVHESLNPDTDIDSGKLIIINDDDKCKIARGVNSLTTISGNKSEEWKKIKIVEGMDLVREDIRSTFHSEYTGKVSNKYDNKVIFFASVNEYFGELEKSDVLDPDYENKAGIDIEAQKAFLQAKGIDTSIMKEQEIKQSNTGSKLFAKASVRFLDTMEDLYFGIEM